MVVLVLAALAIALLVVVVSIVIAGRRGLELWRTLRAFRATLGRGIIDLESSVAKLAAFEPPDLDRASEAFARLQRDRARLTILLGALGRAREQFSAFAIVYPKK